MPQLFPMNWNILTIMFITLLILTTPLFYFNYKPSPIQNQPNLLFLKKVWKW
uniref:ATP synthase F0 subunit 8 n=1 Tax=Alectorobius peropteryx TaxID=1265610 RepID=UPI002238F138|nr:ATP synthase F0 subunit 8 [Alectorobius peropteryx]UYB78499.1 ATP synthase F0 subunit 8 [Alectorobius peropteryx]UYB78512.1 ATP synthase F0 subunit 8 [Alectorobius peropteryx]